MPIQRWYEKQCEKQISVITRIKIKKKVYQFGGLKDKINSIKKRRIINSIEIYGIITKCIKEVTIQILKHKILQQNKENLPLHLIKTLHRGNP